MERSQWEMEYKHPVRGRGKEESAQANSCATRKERKSRKGAAGKG